MGTNYYTKEKTCPTCGQNPGSIHIGKSSAGWTFSFQYNGGRFYKNVKDMKKWLKTKTIEDEYGDIVSYKEFWNMVVSKQKAKHTHALECPSPTDFMIDGYSFSDCEFS